MKDDRKDDVGGMLRRGANRLEAFQLYREMEYVITEALPFSDRVRKVAAHTANDSSTRNTMSYRRVRRLPRILPSEFTLINCNQASRLIVDINNRAKRRMLNQSRVQGKIGKILKLFDESWSLNKRRDIIFARPARDIPFFFFSDNNLNTD